MAINVKLNPSGFGLISIIIAVAIVGLLAGGGLYWNETQNQKSLFEIGLQKEKEAEALKQKILQQQKERLESIGESSSPSPTPKPTPQPSTAAIDTSTWKTYRNEKYGFEVRYPQGWFVHGGEAKWGSVEEVYITPKADVSKATWEDITAITIYENTQGASPSEWDINEGLGGTMTRVSVNDIGTIRRVYKDAETNKDALSITFVKGNKAFLFDTRDYRLIPVVDQILSTFKFIP